MSQSAEEGGTVGAVLEVIWGMGLDESVAERAP